MSTKVRWSPVTGLCAGLVGFAAWSLVAVLVAFVFPPISVLFAVVAILMPVVGVFARSGCCPKCCSRVLITPTRSGVTCRTCKSRLFVRRGYLQG